MKTLAPLLFLLLLVSAALADPLPAPDGWTVTASGKSFVYVPGDLQPGETYRVTVYPKASFSGLPLADAMERFCDKDAASLGTATGEQKKVKVISGPGGSVANGTRVFVTAGGETQAALYFAASRDGKTVKVARVVATLQDGLMDRYGDGLGEIVKLLGTETGADAPASQTAGRLPFTPSELATVGGKITPGKYVGDYVLSGKVRYQRTIYLYANGDYRLLNGSTEPDFNTGKIGYNPENKSGMLMIHKTIYDLFNDTDTPAETYCFYGHDAAGVAMIYGHRGYPSVVDQVLRYAGPPDRPSPTEVADKKDKAVAAKKEAERYKFVTVPSRGIQEAQIAGVVMHFEMGYYDTILNIDNSKRTLFLLLKDGTYHEDLPVAPCVIDEAVSRRKEPEAWGRWRWSPTKKDTLLLTHPERPGKPEAVEVMSLIPARPADLHGHFGRASSTGSLLGGGSVTQWGIGFGGGRFQTDSSFSFSNGSVAQSDPLSPVIIYGGADDSGAYTSVSGGGATINNITRKSPKGSDRAGTYELRGYSLILHYDSGVTEYTPCYFEGEKREALRFRGALYFAGV